MDNNSSKGKSRSQQVCTAPDTQQDLQFIAMDISQGDYLAAALDIVGLLCPGGTGFGRLLKPA